MNSNLMHTQLNIYNTIEVIEKKKELIDTNPSWLSILGQYSA